VAAAAAAAAHAEPAVPESGQGVVLGPLVGPFRDPEGLGCRQHSCGSCLLLKKQAVAGLQVAAAAVAGMVGPAAQNQGQHRMAY
jgi:hypothetical protein